MAIMRFNYRSQVLGHYVDITVTIPTNNLSYFDTSKEQKPFMHQGMQSKRPMYVPGMKFQTVYVMHGGGDDDSLVFRYTNAERYAENNCVMLVVPNVVHSFGADTQYGKPYSTFITEELPVVIQALFPSSPKREDNFIIGYAMGGNAALGNAILAPQNYAACVDISGGIGYTVRTEQLIEELKSEHFNKNFPLFVNTFGDADRFAGSYNDICAAAKKLVAEGTKYPKLTIVCGSKEFIRKRVEQDVAAMREMGLDVEYILAEGYDHDFVMWDKYVGVALDEILPLKKAPLYAEE